MTYDVMSYPREQTVRERNLF